MVNLSDQVILAIIGAFVAFSSTIIGAYVTVKKSEIDQKVEEKKEDDEKISNVFSKEILISLDDEATKRIDRLNRNVEELTEANIRLAKSIDKHKDELEVSNHDRITNKRSIITDNR